MLRVRTFVTEAAAAQTAPKEEETFELILVAVASAVLLLHRHVRETFPVSHRFLLLRCKCICIYTWKSVKEEECELIIPSFQTASKVSRPASLSPLRVLIKFSSPS